jgi:hypothetical protein
VQTGPCFARFLVDPGNCIPELAPALPLGSSLGTARTVVLPLSGAANSSASNLDGPAAFLALGPVLLDHRCAVRPPTDVAH